MKEFTVLNIENYPNDTWIEIIVKIRNNATGEIKETTTQSILDDNNEWSSWMWTDGNYSCDCNRKIFFDDKGYQEDVPCSEGQYSVVIINPKNNNVLYKEFNL